MYSLTGVGRELSINAQKNYSAAVSLSQLYRAWLPEGALMQDVKSDLLISQLLGGPPQCEGSLQKLLESAPGKLKPRQ